MHNRRMVTVTECSANVDIAYGSERPQQVDHNSTGKNQGFSPSRAF